MKSQVRATVGVLALLMTGFAVWMAWRNLAQGIATAVVGLALVGAFGAWSLRRGPHTPWQTARKAIAPGHALVLWKPGCSYCERLLRALRRDPRITWVNVWHDDAANAEVEALNDGNEYTPTVLIGDQVLRNPSASEVRSQLRASPTQ